MSEKTKLEVVKEWNATDDDGNPRRPTAVEFHYGNTWKASVKWDGCVEIRLQDCPEDFIHICNFREFAEFVLALLEDAQYVCEEDDWSKQL